MRKYLVLVLMLQSFCSYAFNGCFDMQGLVVKAGEKNSIVTLHMYDVVGAKSNKVSVDNYEYIPRIKYII